MLSQNEITELQKVAKLEQEYIYRKENSIVSKAGEVISKPINHMSKFVNKNIKADIIIKIKKQLKLLYLGA